jgi:four helix bundle protein
MQNYKDLQVWKKSHDLTLEIYKATKLFPKEEVFGLVSQLRRASSSIPTNIAEGSGRFTQKDFASFLQISLGSSQEVEYLIFLSKELNYIKEVDFVLLEKSIGEIKAMLIALIKKVRI